jgi:uncharacterized protein
MKNFLLTLIRQYKKYLSPTNFGFHTCRFTPSCADYTYEAVEKYGTVKGSWLGLLRVLRCNPFSKGGYDPVK